MPIPLVSVILLKMGGLDFKGELLDSFSLIPTGVCQKEKEQVTVLAELLLPKIACGL